MSGCGLTDLQLSLDPPFAPLPEVHLRLVVLGHHLHKLPGEHGMLGGGREGGRDQWTELMTDWITIA